MLTEGSKGRHLRVSHLGVLHRYGKVQAAAMMSWNLPFTTLLGKVHGLKAGLGVEEKNSLDFSLVITQTNKD